MKEQVSEFYDHHIKYLMYRDWSGFELFYIEILKCASLPALRADRAPVRDVPRHPAARGAEAVAPPGPAPAREDLQELLGP